MFANTNAATGGFGFPDVCQSPGGNTPVPIPFPNLAMTITEIPSVFSIFLSGVPLCSESLPVDISNVQSIEMDAGVVRQSILTAASNPQVRAELGRMAERGTGKALVQFPHPIGEAQLICAGARITVHPSALMLEIVSPAERPTNPTEQNSIGANPPGITVAPEQIRVIAID